MIGNAWDKGPKLRVEQNEAFQECYRTYINNKDFPQRNLMAKKQQFSQGLLNSKELKERKDHELEVLIAYPEKIPALQKKELPKTEKELAKHLEDGVEKYQVVEEVADERYQDRENIGIKEWIEQSNKLSQQVTEDRLRREKRESEDQKKREKRAR